EAAESADRALAHTALHTLGTLSLPAATVPRFIKLLSHEDPERVRFAASYLGGQASATKPLVKALLAQDRHRAAIVAETLVGRPEASAAIARALLETKDAERATLFGKVLLPNAKTLSSGVRKDLLALVEKRLKDPKSADGWRAPLEVAQ